MGARDEREIDRAIAAHRATGRTSGAVVVDLDEHDERDDLAERLAERLEQD